MGCSNPNAPIQFTKARGGDCVSKTIDKLIGICHMVMQQDKPLIVWGWAQPNEKVTVELSGGSQQVQANDRGEWKAVLPERGHGKGLNRRLEFEPGAWFEGSCG